MQFHSIKFLIFLLFLPAGFLSAQCDLEGSVQDVVASRDLDKMLDYSIQLESCTDLEDSLAYLYHKIGIRYYVIEDYETAIAYTKKGLELRNKLFKKPHFDKGQSHHNLGVFYKKQEDLINAEVHFKNAGEIYDGIDSSNVSSSYWELSQVYFLKGEYNRALKNLDYALSKAKGFKDERRILNCYLEYGNIHRNLNQYQAAIDSLLKAKEILDQYYLGWDHATLYTNLASNYLKSGQYQAAITYGKKVIPLWEDFEDAYQQSNEWNNLGLAYTRLGDFENAAACLNKGKAVAEQHNIGLVLSQSQNNFGELFLAQGQVEKAVQSFHDGVRTLVVDFDAPQYLENPSRKQVQRVSLKRKVLNDLSDKAAGLLLLYESQKQEHILSVCREAYDLCDYIIDLLLMEQTEQNSRLFWREKVIPIYEKAIRAASFANDPAEAFHYFEKSKAFLLLENLQYSEVIADLPNATQNNLSELRQALLTAQQALEDADESQKNQSLETLLNRQKELDDYRAMLNSQFASYAAMTSTLQVLSFDEYKTDPLNEGVTSVHFFYGNDHIYALVIPFADPAEVYNLGERSEIEQGIRTYLAYFEERLSIENEPLKFIDVAHQLYQVLIKPLNLKTGEELLIFPDGALAYLPFDALVSKPAANLNTANFLLQDHEVRFAYSASILNQQQSSLVGQKTLSAFAPFASAGKDKKYATLSYSNDELNQIQVKVKGNYYLDEHATLDQFKDVVDAHGVIHLSTHAFSAMDSEKPYIVFSDTVLYLSDLYGMHLSVDLVVLSACQSNIGKLAPGEGVLSLGRGFTYAGARSMVSSLWNVNAQSTGTILAAFYEQLQSGTSKHKALSQSKRSYLSNPDLASFGRSPYYWAGLVYYGGDDTLLLDTPISNWWYLGIGALGLLVIGGFYIKQKK